MLLPTLLAALSTISSITTLPTLTVTSPTPPIPTSALYVTTRLVPASNIALYAANGKVLPLSASRFPSPTFPFQAVIDPQDILEPYRSLPPADLERLTSQEIVVSARLDSDGDSATRGPEDLVGRTLCAPKGGGGELRLGGRGLTGRILTKGSYK